MNETGAKQRTTTQSRRLGITLFLLILLLMLLLSPRLRVYYGVTVVDVSIEQVMPDGARRALPTPAEFRHAGAGYWNSDSVVQRLRPRIEQHMKSSEWASAAPDGAHFEWIIRWSVNSTKLDQAERIVWEVPSNGDK